MASRTVPVNESLANVRGKAARARVTLSSILKRIFDFLAAALALLMLWPFFVVVPILLRREGPGPVYYRGRRIGKDGKEFWILKFRTMIEEPKSYEGNRVTAQDDERITPLGRWLRDTKVNELPQFWNVLKGDMSLVGPRPEDPQIAQTWPEAMRREIHLLRPGITSPASVLYRDEEKMLHANAVMDDYLMKIMPDKLRLDLLYVRTHNFLSDIDVLMWTLAAVFPATAHRKVRENTLYSGPITRLMRQYVNWFFIDALVTLAATGFVGGLARLAAPLNFGWRTSLVVAVGIALLFGAFNAALGLKRVNWKSASSNHVFDLGFASALATGFVWMVGKVWGPGQFLSLSMLTEIGLLAFFGFVVVRYRQRLLWRLLSRWMELRGPAATLGERVLIVGAGDMGLLSAWLLRKSKLASAFTIVGMVDDDPYKYQMVFDGKQVLGTTSDIPDLVKKYNIGVIMYAISDIQVEDKLRIMGMLRKLPVRVVVIPDLIKLLQEKLLRSNVNEG